MKALYKSALFLARMLKNSATSTDWLLLLLFLLWDFFYILQKILIPMLKFRAIQWAKFSWERLFFARSTFENLGLFVCLCYMKRGYVHVILICSHLTSMLVYSFLRLARWFLDSFPIFNALRSVEEIFCHPKCFTERDSFAIHPCASLCFIKTLHV